MDYISMFEQYAKLPTARRVEGMTSESLRNGKIFLKKLMDYLKAQKAELNLQTFSYFLLSYDNINTRAVILRRLGPFFVWHNLLSKDDYKKLCEMFRFKSTNWSEKALGNEELKTILKAVRKCSRTAFSKSRNIFLLLLLSATAGRIGQVLALKKDDIIDKGEYFEILLPTFKKKDSNDHDKDVKVVSKDFHIGLYYFEDYLNRYYQARSHIASDDVFVTQTGKKLRPEEVRIMFNNVSKAINIKVTPHTIRHTIGTFVANEIGVMEANRLLNHQSIITTQKYIKKDMIKINVPPID